MCRGIARRQSRHRGIAAAAALSPHPRATIIAPQLCASERDAFVHARASSNAVDVIN
jgi:hypothetical protein